MSDETKAEWNELWWIDYLEAEIDDQKSDATESDGTKSNEKPLSQWNSLSMASAIDKTIYKNLKTVRKVLKQNAGVELPTEPSYYQKLHTKIVAAILSESSRPEVKSSQQTESYVWKVIRPTSSGS